MTWQQELGACLAVRKQRGPISSVRQLSPVGCISQVPLSTGIYKVSPHGKHLWEMEGRRKGKLGPFLPSAFASCHGYSDVCFSPESPGDSQDSASFVFSVHRWYQLLECYLASELLHHIAGFVSFTAWYNFLLNIPGMGRYSSQTSALSRGDIIKEVTFGRGPSGLQVSKDISSDMDPGFGGEPRERQTKKASGCGGQGDRDEDSSRRQKGFWKQGMSPFFRQCRRVSVYCTSAGNWIVLLFIWNTETYPARCSAHLACRPTHPSTLACGHVLPNESGR